MKTMLDNYSVVDTGWYGLLLKRNNIVKEQTYHSQAELCEIEGGWDCWIELPDSTASLVELHAAQTLWGRICGFIYKPDIFTVDYLLPDSTWRTYRFSQAMAEAGIWIGPLAKTYADLTDLFVGNCSAPKPMAIRLHAIHPSYHQEKVRLRLMR